MSAGRLVSHFLTAKNEIEHTMPLQYPTGVFHRGFWVSVFAGMTTFLAAALLFAQTPNTADANLEARVKALSAELRCLVCQNQTVADSDAPVARDMRDQVRIQLAAGKTESEVKQYMTERFGDFVLYKPAFKGTTLALWIGPFVVLLIAIVAFVGHVRKKTATVAPLAMTDADRKRARAMLHDAANNATNDLSTATPDTKESKQ
jgi:cytochrome c-type biogenesis protein CcmH